MPRGYGHDPVSSLGIYARFSGQFFIKFSQNKIVMGKKIVVPSLDVILIAVFPRNIWRKTVPVLQRYVPALVRT